MSRQCLQGQTVIITGASDGIGRELAARLILHCRCRIIGIGRDEEKMKWFLLSLGSAGSRFSYCLFDVRNETAWREFAAYLKESDIQPAVLINNAGVLPPFCAAARTCSDVFRHTMDINFFGAVYAVRALLPLLRQADNPAIFNIASSDVLAPVPGTAAYSASKSALAAFTDALREELRGQVSVSAVYPGFCRTSLFRGQTSDTSSPLLRAVSMPADKMADRILAVLCHRQPQAVIGADAQLMKWGRRLLGTGSLRLTSGVLKLSRLPLFADVFEKSRKK